MEVILREDYLPLGYVGDTVKVKRGFARNYLIPRGVAVEASMHNDRMLKHKLTAIISKRIKKKAEAEQFGAILQQITVEFTLKIGQQGKSFGAITTRDIEGALKTLGYTVDRRQIRVLEAIRGVGSHTVEVKLHSEVSVPLQIKVMAAQAPVVAASEDDAEDSEKAKSKKGKKKQAAPETTEADADAEAGSEE